MQRWFPIRCQPTCRIGPGGTGPADKAGEYLSVFGNDVPLPDVNAAFCFLTEVAGYFEGPGERVRIEPRADGRQYLMARHANGQGTSAKARCVAYDQRTA